MPMLVIGAATGAFCGLLSTLGLISPDFVPQFVICAMGGMLAAAMRTPILAILLVLEMTDSFSNIYAIGIVTLVAYSCGGAFKRTADLRFLVASHEWSKQSRIGANLLSNEGAYWWQTIRMYSYKTWHCQMVH